MFGILIIVKRNHHYSSCVPCAKSVCICISISHLCFATHTTLWLVFATQNFSNHFDSVCVCLTINALHVVRRQQLKLTTIISIYLIHGLPNTSESMCQTSERNTSRGDKHQVASYNECSRLLFIYFFGVVVGFCSVGVSAELLYF